MQLKLKKNLTLQIEVTNISLLFNTIKLVKNKYNVAKTEIEN